ncbi:MAG TPA: twin-arginine translocation signal domain-containing protein [Gammaproteobacteria bacterium]|nr:twin-arginine translocation signal domain-containing protein [Gammaproteobacteria bacterium]
MTTRRKFLQGVGAGAGMLVLPAVTRAGRRGGGAGGGGAGGGGGMGGGGMGGGAGGATAPVYELPLNIPPVLAPVSSSASHDLYVISQENASLEIIPGTRTDILGYEGMTPGPTIRVDANRRTIVRQVNNTLDTRTTTHLHGGHIDPRYDGHPIDLIGPGEFKDYDYSNKQLPATLWYHDHTMDLTGDQVYAGLAGFYLVDDDYERSLGLPAGDYEVPLVVQDRTFAADGSLVYRDNFRGMGEFGDTILVNGTPYPRFEVANRKYRFRLLNGSNARFYNFTLSNGGRFIVIGTDGGLLDAPVALNSLSVSPAERYDFIIDFSNVPVGQSVTLNNTGGGGMGGGGGGGGGGNTFDIMRFDVAREEIDDSIVPQTLRRVERIDPAGAATTRRWVFDRRGRANTPWTINGRPYDPEYVGARVKLGTTEIWDLVNRTGMIHPVHIHDLQFQILDINGRTPPPHLAGWKDTFQLPPGGRIRVIGRYDDYVSDPNDVTTSYMMHCHILEHEDHAMMVNWMVVE